MVTEAVDVRGLDEMAVMTIMDVTRWLRRKTATPQQHGRYEITVVKGQVTNIYRGDTVKPEELVA